MKSPLPFGVLKKSMSTVWDKVTKEDDIDTLRALRDRAVRDGDAEMALRLAIKIDKKRGLY